MSGVVVVTPTLGTSLWLSELELKLRSFGPILGHVLVCPKDRVSELKKQYPAAQVVSENGGGMYAAINTGLAVYSNWDAFTYINDDDLLLSGFADVLAHADAPMRNGLPLMIYGQVKLINERGARLGLIPVSPIPASNRALYAERLEPVYQHGTIITRVAWELHGGFDESFRFCGDSEYLARLCVRGVPAVRVGATVAAFRLRKGQLTKNRAAMLAERRRVDEKLGLLLGPSRSRRLIARWAFRLANAPAYAERIARHGFISFDQLLERVE